MKRIPIYRDEFHRVRMQIKEMKHNRQLVSIFNNMYR